MTPNYWEEEERAGRGYKSVLQASELVLGHPVVTLLQIVFRRWRDSRVINKPVHEFSLFGPRWSGLLSVLLVESFLGLHHLNGPGVDLEDSLHLIDGVPSGVKVSLHFTKIIYYKLQYLTKS